MYLYFDNIDINDRRLIEKGCFCLREHTIHVIHGKNGCGKTLLLKNIQMNPQNEGYRIVLMDQNNTLLLPGMDVLHNIAMTNDSQRLEEVKAAMIKMGYEQLLLRNIKKLSGGESRLVNALRCAMSDADVLLIDEPTNDLDYIMVEQMVALIRTLRDSKTMLIVTHDDRMDELADVFYNIADNRVQQVGKTETVLSQKPVSDTGSGEDGRKICFTEEPTFIKKAFHYNFVPVLLTVLFVMVLCLQALEYKTVAGEEVPRLADNQVNIYNFYSRWQDLESGKGMPAFAVRTLSSISMIDQVKIMGEIEAFFQKSYAELYEIPLESSETYTVYPMEFFNPETEETIFVLDYYLQKYHEISLGEAGIRTDDCFDEPDILKTGDKVYTFDSEKYLDCVEEIKAQDSYILMAAYVTMKEGYSVNDFLNSEIMNEMSAHTCLVASNETYAYQHQLKLLSRIGKEIKVLLFMALATCVSGICSLYLFLTLKKQTIMVFRNYGVSDSAVQTAAQHKMNNRIVLLAAALSYGIWNAVYYRLLPFSQANFIFFIVLIIYLSLVYKMGSIITGHMIKKYYRWYER
ncbi:MAG: ATP-binding cassette domain-containing protein [Lachnospiraceae bacterium]